MLVRGAIFLLKYVKFSPHMVLITLAAELQHEVLTRTRQKVLPHAFQMIFNTGV
jgi:hypothetical protein